MLNILGMRLEDKNKWERRAPLIPKHIKELVEKHEIQFIIQSSSIRIFEDQEYLNAGADVSTSLDKANIIFAIKEIPLPTLKENKIYIFFSHTIKGQRRNMPMLKHILNLNSTLIDYERIVNSKGFRLIFFGNYAGLAGMIETLRGYGQRVLAIDGVKTPFLKLKHTYEYSDLSEAKQAISNIGSEIQKNGLPEEIIPVVVGFAGYGNVSKGAQSILDLLPVIEISPTELEDFWKTKDFSFNHIYKSVFKEEHMVQRKDQGKFDLQDYYKSGLSNYEGIFSSYTPYLSILVNGIYWSEKYPRLLTKKHIRDMFQSKMPVHLRIIGDISCDIEGGIEATIKVTEPDNPMFIYDPFTEKASHDGKNEGLAIIAVDNLPCELPRESSTNFSNTLVPFIPIIAKTDFNKPFEDLALPPELKNAIIVHQGKLTPYFQYLDNFLREI